MLVSTDCGSMGVHVPDLRLVVNIGMGVSLFLVSVLKKTVQDCRETCGNCLKLLDELVVSRRIKLLQFKYIGLVRKVHLVFI